MNNVFINNSKLSSSPFPTIKGTLPSSTMAVPVQYLGSSDITGLQTPAHFYRIIVPHVSSSISGHQQDLLMTKREEFSKEGGGGSNPC